MNYGFNVAASGVLTNMYRMDVMANNLANISTVGFKPEVAMVRQRDVARVEDNLPHLPSNAMLERLGAGVMPMPTRISFSQGTISSTGNPLDVAIQGEGFFVVQDGASSGADRFRLTRDGRFTRDRDGRLVGVASGMPVMDAGNRPIVIPDDAPVTIDARGTIRQRGAVLAQLQVTRINDPQQLRKAGDGMFVASAAAWDSRRTADVIVTQNAIEESAVDPVSMMMGITDAGRAAESSMGMVSNFDRMLERAINTLGRTSG